MKMRIVLDMDQLEVPSRLLSHLRSTTYGQVALMLPCAVAGENLCMTPPFSATGANVPKRLKHSVKNLQLDSIERSGIPGE